MHAAAVRNRYMADSVTTTSPARLVTMLYDAVVRDLDQAVSALAERDLETVSRRLVHAQDVIAELHASLDTSAWEGGPALASLYEFLGRELIAANVAKDGARMLACRQLVEPLRLAWHEAAGAGSAEAAAVASADVVGLGA